MPTDTTESNWRKNVCPACKTHHPNGWACPKDLAVVRETLRELVGSIDAETEASKKWYLNPASSKKWDRAGKRRAAAMDQARAALHNSGGSLPIPSAEPADSEVDDGH